MADESRVRDADGAADNRVALRLEVDFYAISDGAILDDQGMRPTQSIRCAQADESFTGR
jgi:hypothetical protein